MLRYDEMSSPNEKTSLLKVRPSFTAIGINTPKYCTRQALTSEDLAYYHASPLWRKVRLCLFWFFWIVFFMVLVLSLLTYFCIFPSMCRGERFISGS